MIMEHWALHEKYLEKHLWAKKFPSGYQKAGEIIPRYNAFEVNPYYNEEKELLKKYFAYKNEDFKKANWLDIRFLVHSLAAELYDEGWLHPNYSDKILQEDLEAFKKNQSEFHQSSLIRFRLFGYSPHATAGHRIINHFMGNNLAKEAWKSKSRLATIIDSLIYSKIKHLTRENLIYKLGGSRVNPEFYKSFYDQWFPIKNKTILDIYPSGSKALATMSARGVYIHNSEELQPKIKKMARFVDGAECFGLVKSDLALISDWQALSKEEAEQRIKKHKKHADNLFLVIKSKDREYFNKKFKKKKMLRISTGVGTDAHNDDYILLIDQS